MKQVFQNSLTQINGGNSISIPYEIGATIASAENWVEDQLEKLEEKAQEVVADWQDTAKEINKVIR